MKAPSKNVSRSIAGQSTPTRGAESVQQGRQRAYGPSMTVPGEGGTEKAPGTGSRDDGRQDRSASVHGDALGKHFGWRRVAINRVTRMTQTVLGNQDGRNFSQSLHRDWDKPAGIDQALSRVDKRTAQGQKKTPIGAGKLKGK